MARLYNQTRTSPSIPKKLCKKGKFHLLPVYALLQTSDLGREAIEHSGSYRLADHIYRNVPAGRFGIGWWIDRMLLRYKGAQSIRNRFLHNKEQLLAGLQQCNHGRCSVLSTPCGIARDLVETAQTFRTSHPDRYATTTFYGLDLDPTPLAISRSLAQKSGVNRFQTICADAFNPAVYPPDLNIILSTGFGDFLNDEDLLRFYTLCHKALHPDGMFVTSGMQPDPFADYLAEEVAELCSIHRTSDQMVESLKKAGFTHISARPDKVGLQTLLVARK